MSEALYLEFSDLSNKAQKIVDKLDDTAELLIKQLRVSAMEDIHEISTKFGRPVMIHYRKNRDEHIAIAKFNNETVRSLQAKESVE